MSETKKTKQWFFQNKDFWEWAFYGLVLFAALSSIIFLFMIIISIFAEGRHIFDFTNLKDFVLGIDWYPTDDSNPEYGILPLIIGSVVVTVISLVFAIFLGVGSGIYISEIAGHQSKELLKPFVELLASIPSVIYGLFGMAFLAPFIQRTFNLTTGMNALTAGIILGIMVVPIISSVTEDAIYAVPKSLREASFALGANRLETIFRSVLPAAKSGVLAGIILGFGRSIGETMVVLMVAGNAAIIPGSIFDPVRPMTSTIAAEMGESELGSPHYFSLFGIAMVLFLITFITNIVTEYIKGNIGHANKRKKS